MADCQSAARDRKLAKLFLNGLTRRDYEREVAERESRRERERVCVGVAACKCYAIMRNKSSEKRQATLQGGMRFKCQPFIKPADGQMANGKRKMTLERAEGSQSRQSRQSAR